MTRTEQKAYDEALKRIDECRRKKGTRLNLRGLGLTRVPAELGQLTALTVLDLQNNQLTAVPAELGRLTALTDLSFYNNRLTAVPTELGQLTALTDLSLSGNQLTTVPAELGQLTALTRLSLSKNQLTTVPAELGQLAALTVLYVQKNKLTLVPAELGQLTALKYLWLQSNRLSMLPPQLKELRNLEHLFLHNNPALNLSPAVLGADRRTAVDGYASPKAILDFYFSRQTQKTRPLNELKMILVGRGGAGKTSTVRALMGKTVDDEQKSTPGIALCDWVMDECKGGAVTAHVWDFAGQVITHALHQFFFSVRSIYVVVLTGRENSEREDAEYWLRLIKAFGTDAEGEGPPVLVALNKWDVDGCRPRVDRGALEERYPFIRGFVELDCKSGRGVAKLKKALGQEVSRLKWVREPFAETWDAARRALAKDGKKRAHLTYHEYRALCTEHGVTDPGHQDSLSEILHRLGAALNYRTDKRLREATVLQPAWLTKNVYALMRRAEKQGGVLKQADVETVLKAEQDRGMRDYLMKIMERFEIEYAPKLGTAGSLDGARDHGLWVVPQALANDQPRGADAFAKETEATRLRYTYPALPEGLVARAIVRLHEFIEEAKGRKQQWASGAILAREGARALLRTEPQDRVVMVTVTGPPEARQPLAGLCQAVMRDIHQDIPGLDAVEEMEVEGEWVKIEGLEEDEKRGQRTGVQIKGRGTVMVDPAEANNAFTKKPARQEDLWKPAVFISYSKSNVSQRKRLELELKVLMNEGLVARTWQDRMIAPGDEWHEAIQRELEAADVVILMTSVHSLATDYINEHEIPKAIELHEARRAVVVPLILADCRWEQTPLGKAGKLGKLLALPAKGKALDQWARKDDAWKTVADGLAMVFQKLIAARRARG